MSHGADMEAENQSAGNTEKDAPARQKVTVDQEAWVIQRLREFAAFVSQAQNLSKSMVGAGQPMINGAIDGALHGVAVEIIRTLNMEPIFTHLQPREYNANNGLDAIHLLERISHDRPNPLRRPETEGTSQG